MCRARRGAQQAAGPPGSTQHAKDNDPSCGLGGESRSRRAAYSDCTSIVYVSSAAPQTAMHTMRRGDCPKHIAAGETMRRGDSPSKPPPRQKTDHRSGPLQSSKEQYRTALAVHMTRPNYAYKTAGTLSYTDRGTPRARTTVHPQEPPDPAIRKLPPPTGIRGCPKYSITYGAVHQSQIS
jgi:hypothetical protein